MQHDNMEIQPIKLGANPSIFGPVNSSLGPVTLNSNVVSTPEAQSFDNTRVTTPQNTTKTPNKFPERAQAYDNAMAAYNKAAFGI